MLVKLQDIFAKLPLAQGYYNVLGLRDVATLAKITNAQKINKSELQIRLGALYDNKEFLIQQYKKLSPGEKELVRLCVYSKGDPDPHDILTIAAQYKLDRKSDYYDEYLRLTDFMKYNSSIWILIPGGMMSFEVHNVLFEHLGEFPRPTREVVVPNVSVISREDRCSDFILFVRYCNQYSCSVTKNGLLNKPSAVAFCRDVGYAELTDSLTTNPSDARTIQKMRVTFPICLAARAGSLMSIENGKAVPSIKAPQLLQLATQDLQKHLYESYQKDKTTREIDYMQGIREYRKQIQYPKARMAVANEIKSYPVGKVMSVQAVLDYMRICDRHFLRQTDSDVLLTTGNYMAPFSNVEEPFFYTVLSVYGALGMLELGWALRKMIVPSAYNEDCEMISVPVTFKITPLGAWIWGLSKEYKPLQKQITLAKSGFVVQPDFSVMIPESQLRLTHEFYFERFLTKKSDDKHMGIYRLDIDGILKALNLGMQIADIRTYLQTGADKPLPDNICRALDDWEAMSQKIRIRNVTILETDDPILLEELLHIKGMDTLILGRIGAGAVILPGTSKKIKSTIEKTKRFCKDEYSK